MIISRLKGGMGNQMFQYAFSRALALHNKTDLALDISWYEEITTPQRTYDLDLYSIQALLLPPKKESSFTKIARLIRRKLLPAKGMERFFHFDQAKMKLGPNETLEGYWQSPKYFEEYKDVIKKDFTLKNKLSDTIENEIKKIQSEESVCIHIRRGDYVGNPLHDAVGLTYYSRALTVLASMVTIKQVYIFSDDIQWCKEHLTLPVPLVFVGNEFKGNRGIGHFSMMRACKHFIITNSSFSWWAAYLASNPEKIVIAPKKWFNDSRINTDDLIPAEWIRI